MTPIHTHTHVSGLREYSVGVVLVGERGRNALNNPGQAVHESMIRAHTQTHTEHWGRVTYVATHTHPNRCVNTIE